LYPLRLVAGGEILQVDENCLMFFVDETGHEEFADPEFPVYGICGCALLAAVIEPNLRQAVAAR
jgi:hypothetical protein